MKIQRYMSVLDCFSDAAMLVAEDGMTIVYINEKGCELLECDPIKTPLALSRVIADSNMSQGMHTVIVKNSSMRLHSVAVCTHKSNMIDCAVEISMLDDDMVCCVLKPTAGQAEAVAKSVDIEDDMEQLVRNVLPSIKPELLFRYILATGEIFYFGTLQEESVLPRHCLNYPAEIIESGLVYAEDTDIFLQFVDNVHQGVEKPLTFRVYNKKGQLIWFKKEYSLCKDENGNILEAVGRLVNVNLEKVIATHASVDELTGCMRKQNFESQSIAYLAENTFANHALILVDLDNFKAINDNLGHQFGDNVLREVGAKLRGVFRNSDCVGRIGGDEFMILMKDIHSYDIVETKAREILKLLENTYSSATHSYHISSSIGIARYPEDGQAFSELYDHADIAMYDAKNRGKNNIVAYNDNLSKGTMVNTMPFDVAARTLSQHFDPKVVAEVFNLLFESNDIDISMQTVLKSIGSRFGVSRAYVFELSPEIEKIYKNTYEWCAQDVSREKGNLQNIPAHLFTPFFEQANGEGILYCNDLTTLNNPESYAIMAAQDIQSFLHAYIGPKELPIYVVGFDDCCTTRIWRPIEISTLLYISKIIGQFLNHHKTLQVKNALYAERMDALNTMNFSAYIIDSDTYELLFINKKMRKVLPDLQLGDMCYHAIRGNDAECENCPMKHMRENGLQAYKTIIYNGKLDTHFLVNTTYLNSYDGRSSVFLAANDINHLIQKDTPERM